MPQAQPNTGFGQNKGIIQALLDLAIPNASADTQKQADTMNQQNDISNHPIIKATQKALDKTIGESVPQAVASGVPISHIMNHAYTEAVNSSFGGTPSPMDMGSIQQSSSNQTITNNGSQNIDILKQQIQRNVLNNLLAQSQPKGILGGFAQGFNNAVGNTAINTEQMKAIATLAGLSPESQYQLAGASELTQSAKQKELANAGKTPLQQADILAATTAAQQKQIESKKAELEAEKTNLQALIKTQGDTISHPAALLMGGQGLKDLHISIQDSLDRIKGLQGEMNSLSSNYSNKTGAAKSGSKSTPTPEQARAMLRARKVKGY